VTADSESIAAYSGPATRTLRNAKSFVTALDIPLMARASFIQGFDKVVNSDRAELVPLFNPATVIANQKVSVKLYLKGKPLSNTEVSMVRRSINTNPQTVKTDAKGVATFQLNNADFYLFRAKPNTTESLADQYSSTNYETTMTIKAQNAAKKSNIKTSQAPQIFVNGTLQSPNKIAEVKGVTMIDAAFIKKFVSNKHQNKGQSMVPLRGAIQSVGATLIYLPSVNGLPAGIYIYS
jgi:hypothetical protein